ncbi:MAG: phosphotransferase family protein [Deltaproteobacteria bacterium]|nr:phosphotransferase family protein [Deltaproteobacteria bacterium]
MNASQEELIVESARAGLREKAPGARVDVQGLRRLTGGSVREIWGFDAVLARDGEPPERRPLVFLLFRARGPEGKLSPEQEFRLLEIASAAGVPVPQPVWQGKTAAGEPFYVMARVEGETIGSRILRDDRLARARAALPAQVAAAAAAIHRVPLGPELDFLEGPPADRAPADWEIARIEDLYRLVTPDPHPVFELALRWLRQHLPPGTSRALVHGDFRIGNVIVDETGLRAVLDWELAHIGDPMEDLGWFCVRSWRFRADHLPAGGVGSRESLLDAYAKAGGGAADPARLRFWEIFGNLRWGVLTLVQARFFLGGASTSVELASIGRRTAETEWELLNLLESA